MQKWDLLCFASQNYIKWKKDIGIADATDAQCVIMALKFPEDTSKLQVSSAQTV